MTPTLETTASETPALQVQVAVQPANQAEADYAEYLRLKSESVLADRKQRAAFDKWSQPVLEAVRRANELMASLRGGPNPQHEEWYLMHQRLAWAVFDEEDPEFAEKYVGHWSRFADNEGVKALSFGFGMVAGMMYQTLRILLSQGQ